MKTVYYIRHAKSSWAQLNQEDVLRPLNGRGRSDAPKMAKHLQNTIDQSIDISRFAILSSPSVRTKQTLSHFQSIFDIPNGSVFIDESLYHPHESQFEESLFQLDDVFQSTLLFSHNPAITHYANLISEKLIENIPTCGIFRVDYDVESWTDIDLQSASMIFFIYPKMLKK